MRSGSKAQRGVIASAGILMAAVALADANPPGDQYGANLTLAETTSLAEVVAAPQRFASKSILLRGRLTDLCTKKGCWTVVAQGTDSIRVRFADYGFFLPQEALGREALIEGVAEVRSVSEKEARHIAQESRHGNPDEISGPQQQLGLVATGVRILRPPETAPRSSSAPPSISRQETGNSR